MKPSSCKSKGRNLQQSVRDLIYSTWPHLEEGDCRSTSMGTSGEDIQLSPAAKKVFPFNVECKNVEKLSFWAAFEQAEAHNKGKKTWPLLIVKKNRKTPIVVLKIEHLMQILKERA